MFSGLKNKMPLAKAVVIFSAIFTISFGLCGLNVAASSYIRDTPGFLVVTGVLEILGMFIGLLGLVIVGLIAIVRAIFQSLRGD